MVSVTKRSSHTGITYLSRSVDDLSCVILAIVLDNPAECVLNCRIIAFHEVVLDKANGER